MALKLSEDAILSKHAERLGARLGITVDGCKLYVSTVTYKGQRYTRVEADGAATLHYAGDIDTNEAGRAYLEGYTPEAGKKQTAAPDFAGMIEDNYEGAIDIMEKMLDALKISERMLVAAYGEPSDTALENVIAASTIRKARAVIAKAEGQSA